MHISPELTLTSGTSTSGIAPTVSNSERPKDVKSPSDPVEQERNDIGRCIGPLLAAGESRTLNWLARITTLLSILKEALAVSSTTIRRMLPFCSWFREIVGCPWGKLNDGVFSK